MSAKLCFAEYTIKIVFSAEHSFKPLSRPLPKMTLLQPKVPFWVFPCACWSPIFVVLGDFEWAQTRTIFQKQIVATKMRTFFYLPNTYSVCLFSKKIHFNNKNLLSSQPAKKHYFAVFIFCFFIFFTFLFCFLQHKTKTKYARFFFFRIPFFSHPENPPKNYFCAPTHYLWFKITPKTL